MAGGEGDIGGGYVTVVTTKVSTPGSEVQAFLATPIPSTGRREIDTPRASSVGSGNSLRLVCRCRVFRGDLCCRIPPDSDRGTTNQDPPRALYSSQVEAVQNNWCMVPGTRAFDVEPGESLDVRGGGVPS